MTSILVTGANGFVGHAVCIEALGRGLRVKGATRTAGELPAGVNPMVIGPIDGDTDWTEALREVDVVIHLAARVHVMKDVAADPLSEFLRVNVQGTERLARQAAQAGVKRLVYVSSIKVNGERTDGRPPFSESDAPHPQDAYAISKWQAEQSLHRIAQETGLEVVIVRPPLVYGPGVKGNFPRLLMAVDKGIPLPFAAINSMRSMIYLDNLVGVLLLCASHPSAAGKTYLVRDGDDVAIPELVHLLAKYLGKSARIFSLPVRWLRALGTLTGQQESVNRIIGSLSVNDDLVRKELDWKPQFTLQQGLQATVAWYKGRRRPPTIPYLKKYSKDDDTLCKVSVVIVNYNAGAILLECVERARQQAEQIIVVDNASADDSIAELRNAFPQVKIICNERNLGFARACNLGAMAADGKCILFLNPDCLLEPDTIALLVQAVHSAPDVGMVGGLLVNPDGTEQIGGRRAVPTPWRSFVRAFGLSALSNRYPRLFSDFALHKEPLPDFPLEVEAISGACMLVRRDLLEEIGLFDEGYFMHCEDLDWCMRFRQEEWKILFVPDARMIHHKGHCSKARPIFVEWHKHKGMMRFYHKFFRHQYPGLLMALVVLGVWLRFVSIAGYRLLSWPLSRQTGLRRD
jgi:GT2 family glycosyltransferase/nucleoside-diphosphate-sugar epimerase